MMRKHRIFKRMAAVLAAVLLSLPSMSAMAGTGLPELRAEFVTRNVTEGAGKGVQTGSDSFIPDEDEMDDQEEVMLLSDRSIDDGIELASSSSARSVYTIDGEVKDSISFYMKRDYRTNRAELPEPVVLRFEQAEGEEDFGRIQVRAGVPSSPYGPSDGLNTEEITRVRIEPEDGYLSSGETLEFKIYFVDQAVADGKESVNNNGEMHFLTVSGGGEEKRIPVYYGADGLYSIYNAAFPGYYDGSDFTDQESGSVFRLVGHVKLNEEEAPTITIRHYFGIYADMTAGTDDQGKPILLRLTRLKLDPDGNFTFSNGAYEEIPRMDEYGVVKISIKLKDDVFKRVKREAERDRKMVLRYVVLKDLVMEYNDGYLAGGMKYPLPLVYAVSYIPTADKRPSGGGGGGGGSSSSGSGSGISGSVTGPGMTPRVTNASAEDIGWVQKDGIWYYMNADNTPVTDWLLAADGRWYFLGMGGAMKTGWLYLGGKWYFLNGDGAMAVGWVQGEGGKWYYLQQDGSMAVNTTTPDGYTVDQDGVWNG